MLLRHIDSRSLDWHEVEEELAELATSPNTDFGRLLPEEVTRLRRLIDAEHMTEGMPHPSLDVTAAFSSPIHFHGSSQGSRRAFGHGARARH